MTSEQLAALLAEHVMGWGVGPDRFVMGNRSWMPRWRFSPLTNLDQAFALIEKAGATYTLTVRGDEDFHAEVRIGNSIGKATGEPKARTITIALAIALGIELEGPDHEK